MSSIVTKELASCIANCRISNKLEQGKRKIILESASNLSFSSQLSNLSSNLIPAASQTKSWLVCNQNTINSVLDTRVSPQTAVREKSKHEAPPALSNGFKHSGVKFVVRRRDDDISESKTSPHRRALQLLQLQQVQETKELSTDKISSKKFLEDCKIRKDVKGAFHFVERASNHSLPMFCQLIAVCAAVSDLEGARKAFRMAQNAGLKPDRNLYNSLIAACCKSQQLDLAFMMFHDMESAGVAPTVKTYGCLINGCASAKQVAKAFGVLGIMMAKKMKPDRGIYHSLILACGNTDSLDRAFDVIQDMKSAKVQPDYQTMTLIIDACRKCRQVERGLGIYRVLRSKGAATRASAFTSAINACSVTGSLPSARQIFMDMKKDRVKVDELVFCALIKVAASADEADYAFSLLEVMKEYNIEVTTRTYNSLLNLCCQLKMPERAMELYRDMASSSRLKPDVVTFNILMQGLCNAQQVDRALELVEDMSISGIHLNHKSYMILIKGCADRSVNKLETAFKLYHAADLEGRSTNLSNCDSMLDLCYEQIRSGGLPPAFSFTVGMFAMDPNMRTPRQQWAACALSIYKQAVGAGVRPTRRLLSKMLGCLRKWSELDGVHADRYDDSTTMFAFRAAAGMGSFGLVEGPPRTSNLEDMYEMQAIPLYEEAAALGIVPDVSQSQCLSTIDLDGLPSHAAEVCILSYLQSLRHSRRKSTFGKAGKISQLLIRVTAHECDLTFSNSALEPKKVQLAGRTAQAITSLLRRLGLPYSGTASAGSLIVTASALQKWLTRQAPLLQSQLPQATMAEAGSSISRLAHNLAVQQRAIRMGASPVYSPVNYYAHPSPLADKSLQRPPIHRVQVATEMHPVLLNTFSVDQDLEVGNTVNM